MLDEMYVDRDDDLTSRDAPPIDTALVRRLLVAQFPHWATLPVRPVELDGWDNRTFRLGDDMSVRLPSHGRYTPAVDKEHRWLPVLAPQLPLPIPVPIARGLPGEGYPFRWSIYRWLDGEPASRERISDLTEFAGTLANFLLALHLVDTTGGPPAGRHNFFRGCPPGVYDGETREAVKVLGDRIDGAAALEVWDTALTSTWQGQAVWLHGDVSVNNLLVRDGRLAAVIDFGTSAVGDPASDLSIAWTLFTGESRAAFRTALGLDPDTWARGRGWTLWKALITLAGDLDSNSGRATDAARTLDEVLADHASER